jgi:hypothetical protein
MYIYTFLLRIFHLLVQNTNLCSDDVRCILMMFLVRTSFGDSEQGTVLSYKSSCMQLTWIMSCA